MKRARCHLGDRVSVAGGAEGVVVSLGRRGEVTILLDTGFPVTVNSLMVFQPKPDILAPAARSLPPALQDELRAIQQRADEEAAAKRAARRLWGRRH